VGWRFLDSLLRRESIARKRADDMANHAVVLRPSSRYASAAAASAMAGAARYDRSW